MYLGGGHGAQTGAVVCGIQTGILHEGDEMFEGMVVVNTDLGWRGVPNITLVQKKEVKMNKVCVCVCVCGLSM